MRRTAAALAAVAVFCASSSSLFSQAKAPPSDRGLVLGGGLYDQFSLPARRQDSSCVDPNPQNTVTDRMNVALNSSGPGYILSLCQGTQYYIEAPIVFAFPGQEISTEGYPIEQEDGTDLRATLVVSGPVADGSGHTTAIDGGCNNCSDIKIRHLIINGTRGDSGPTNGGANIEIGGPNNGQLVEYVKSFDPRSWSCLHIFEGGLQCTNTTIQYNDIGPCGSDYFQYWADGISVACANSWVHGNWVHGATDGGIVLFGSPGTLVENNTIWVGQNTQLGGINMVDIDPWGGNYTGVVVRENTIMGGFATSAPEGSGDTDGTNNETAIMKIGIAIGPPVWFGPQYGSNVSFGGTVLNNRFSGAFGYAMGLDGVVNFTVQGNTLFGNLSYIGTQGPNCSASPALPAAESMVRDANNVTDSNIQSEYFATVASAESLTCIIPQNGDYWPYGGQPSPWVPGEQVPWGLGGATNSSAKTKIGLGVGIPLGIIGAAFLAWYFRRWYLERNGFRTDGTEVVFVWVTLAN
ncbi:hypothetical protein DL93DRAFT_2124939 [Clavulina sp. PMI_390]|nr:hypothetical protein DL93DRAFT_2124939 [Clavulina sp. PMI_390]